ncbi:coiled-coil domain containing 33 [Mustelus asterias]
MHRSRLKIEDKELDFEFEIVNVQFNEVGQYGLRLTVENPLLEGSGVGVKLRVNDGDVLRTNTGSTDIVAQTNINEVHTVLKKKFVFRLPKGYCQNDKNHDVRLRIEAFRVTGSAPKSVKKEGEAFFAIYPRTNAPRINVFAQEHEDFYCYSNIVALLRVQGDELSMHCGRMACNVSFHEVRLPKEAAPRGGSSTRASKEGGYSHLLTSGLPPGPTLEVPSSFPTSSPQQWTTPHSPIPQNESVEDTNPDPSPEPPEDSPPSSLVEECTIHQRLPSDCSFHLSSAEQTPTRTPIALPHMPVQETPPGKTEPTLTSPTNDEHVSRPGKESISVILHGATDLPALSDGSVPQPFVTAKSGTDVEKQQRAQGVTHASVLPTHSPSWEEKVTVEIDEEKAKDEVVVLDIADSGTREVLASFRIPVTYLQMFHHYHIELIQPHPGVPSGTRLFVTLVRKGCIIPRQEGFAFTGFEVLLRAVEHPLKDPVGPLLAVARIVPDYESYNFHWLAVVVMESEHIIVTRTLIFPAITMEMVVLQSGPDFDGCCQFIKAFTLKAVEVATPEFSSCSRQQDLSGPVDGNHHRGFPGGERITLKNWKNDFERAFNGAVIVEKKNPFIKLNIVVQNYGLLLDFWCKLGVSHAGVPQEQPIWDYSFLFQGRDCATIFTAGAALVLEYYPITNVMNTVSWYIRSPLGFSLVPLAQGAFHRLMGESGGHGLRVDGLPVQGNKLRTTSNTNPTVGLLLRLIGSERPDSILAAPDPWRLSTLGSQSLSSSHQQITTAINPEISTALHLSNLEEWAQLSTLDGAVQLPTAANGKLRQDRVSLPPYDALAQILPEYDYLFRSPRPQERQERERQQQEPAGASSPLQAQQAAVPAQKREPPIEDQSVNQAITRHETEELDNYRKAMHKMADDIINLRKDIGRLETENSKLRSELSSHQDLGRTLLDDTDIDVMTKAEIADRIVLLRQKLATETAEVLNCKDKVQQLQNELIRKNDREAELLRVQKAHHQQQAVLQKYQEKIHKSKILEDTIRQQEKVIERMENLLDKKLKEIPREKLDVSKKRAGVTDNSVRKEVESILLAENARLRDEIGKLRHQPVPIILQQPAKEPLPDTEKLGLLAKLEKAQGRVQTLETLLEENSRKWGRQKQEMLTRLSEYEHGFSRTSTMVLHDFPLKNASDSVLTRNRHGMLDPLA